jgi:hypothetical protein
MAKFKKGDNSKNRFLAIKIMKGMVKP